MEQKKNDSCSIQESFNEFINCFLFPLHFCGVSSKISSFFFPLEKFKFLLYYKLYLESNEKTMKTIQSINPYSGEKNGEVELFSAEKLTEIIDTAHSAFESWKNTSFEQRKKLDSTN